MEKLGALAGLMVLAAYVVAGFVPLVECPHPEPHWCELLAKLKRGVQELGYGGDPGPWAGCPRCRDRRRITLARSLLGPPRCGCDASAK